MKFGKAIPLPSTRSFALRPFCRFMRCRSTSVTLSRQPPMPSNIPVASATVLSGTNELDLSAAAYLLRSGKIVAFPTETVYGLGADATNANAIAAVFAAKRRPADNPLIVHISSQSDLAQHVLTPLPLTPIASRLADAFWPGPLTLVLPLSPDSELAPSVTASLPSVAIRVPHHPVAAALLARAQIPVAAPSANLSGRPSPTCAQHVLRDLSHSIDAVVDTSEMNGIDSLSQCGLESTVVDLTGTPTVLRPGAISLEDLQRVAGVPFFRTCDLPVDTSTTAPKAPGMKYRHYAPVAPLIIVQKSLQNAVTHWKTSPTCNYIGVLADLSVCDSISHVIGVVCVPCGSDGTAAGFARSLYAALRAFDGEGDAAVDKPVDVILAVPPSNVEDGIGEAVMNRLYKAAAASQEDEGSLFPVEK